MTAHRSLYDLLIANYDQADPGDTKTIVIAKSMANIKLTSTSAAETRKLRTPIKAGNRCSILHSVDAGGAITITQKDDDDTSVQFDNDGNTTIVFQDVGDWVELLAMDEAGTLQWRVVAGEGTTGSLVAAAVDISVADAGSLIADSTNVETSLAEIAAKGQDLPTTAGAGITGADSFASQVTKIGTLFETKIVIDIDGLNSGGANNDVIGVDGAGAASLGQITAAKNGTIFAGKIECIEVPTGGDPDIDLWAADESTGVEDTLITALTNDTQLTNGGDFAAVAETIELTAFPAANQYLYLACGTFTDATYTAGILVITLWGK